MDAVPLGVKALVVLAIYLIPFLVIGWIGKLVAKQWMDRKGLDLSETEQKEPGSGRRQLFLLGIWRSERGP